MTEKTPNEEFSDAYNEGSARGNVIAGVGAIASLIAAGLAPSLIVPATIAIASEGVAHISRNSDINSAIKEKMKDKGFDFSGSPSDSNAIARSTAGAMMSSGIPLAHAVYESRKAHKLLKAHGALKGMRTSSQVAASIGHAFSSPKTLALGLIAAIIGGQLAPHAARIVGGNPLQDIDGEEINTGELQHESV